MENLKKPHWSPIPLKASTNYDKKSYASSCKEMLQNTTTTFLVLSFSYSAMRNQQVLTSICIQAHKNTKRCAQRPSAPAHLCIIAFPGDFLYMYRENLRKILAWEKIREPMKKRQSKTQTESFRRLSYVMILDLQYSSIAKKIPEGSRQYGESLCRSQGSAVWSPRPPPHR